MRLIRRVQSLEVRVAASGAMRGSSPAPPPAFRRAGDVVELLAAQVAAVTQHTGSDPLDRARTVAAIASIALRAMERADADDRLEAVERVLKLRREVAREAERTHHGKR